MQERLPQPPLILVGLGEREIELRLPGLGHRRRVSDQRLHGQKMRVVGAKPRDACKAVVEFGSIRRQGDGAFESGARVGKPSERHQGLTAMMMRLRDLRIDGDGAVEPGQRVGMVMQLG